MRLDQALARMFPDHSRSRLVAWLRDGHIRIDDAPAKPKQKVWGGEVVDLLPRDEDIGEAARAEDIALDVVHEDAAVIIINKPAGLVVHPGSGNWSGTMLNALLHHAPELAGIPRAGIVHRLDKDTSGLLVVARTLEAQTHLVRQLQNRSVHREYLALVYGRVAGDGAVDAPIGRDPANRVRMAVVGTGKEARTRYRVVERFDQVTLVECRLETGRTHQIRVHMQSIGHALVGDPVYRTGRPASRDEALTGFRRQALHAARLEFIHPTSGLPARFEVPLPADFTELLTALRGRAN
jgi:23S rRNA pseudouridine1911/1915/1917 synthase